MRETWRLRVMTRKSSWGTALNDLRPLYVCILFLVNRVTSTLRLTGQSWSQSVDAPFIGRAVFGTSVSESIVQPRRLA